MDGEILEVLKDIRHEAKQTNVRLAAVESEAKQTNVRLAAVESEAKQTNVRLASVEVRLASVEEHLVSVDEHLVSVDDHLASVDDETKQTNVRLVSLEGRVEFLEKRVTRGFESLNERFDVHAVRVEEVARQQVESENRLAAEVVTLADVVRSVRDVISAKLDDHRMVLDHETRITILEKT